MLMTSTAQLHSADRNHPLAFRMAAIAFMNQNISVACVFGSFSVLLSAVETRLGIGRELSTLAIPLVSLATAVFAPVTGMLATRYSLRLLMLAGAVLSVAGFALLSVTASYPLYLVTYGLLLGPGMAVGAILPATLVTRWYTAHRGRALGIVYTPIVIALMPPAATWVLQSYGLSATYAMLAILSVVTVICALFVVDHPPSVASASTPGAEAGGHAAPAKPARSMVELLRTPRFWLLTFAFVASITGSIILTTQLVPMAESWGLPAELGATLLSVQSSVGIAGPFLFGWVADRLGGAMALAVVALDAALLWALLILHPTFAGTAVIVALIGLHGAAAVPVLGVALSEGFGRESFSRAYGLVNLLNLPFAVLCVPAAALVFSRTGSYAGALMGQAAFLGLTGVLLFSVLRRYRKA
jgi:MFS family permease